MNRNLSPAAVAQPTRVRYGVLGFCCALSMITYLDRVCFGKVGPYVQAEFDLSNKQLGMLFTAFALAYAAFEVPTGWLGDLFGARRTLIRIVLWWSAFTALTGAIYPNPASPWFGFLALLSVRFLFGVGEAGAYPNISRAFASWFPFGERGFAQGAVWMAGRFAGGVTPMVVACFIAYLTFGAGGLHGLLGGEMVDLGTGATWRPMFWVFGGLGVVWCVLFFLFFRDEPDQHPRVNEAELRLIRADAVRGHDAHSNVPWAALLTDLNLWTLCLMYFCAAYGWYFNITYLPKYLKEAYGVTEASHGFWSTNVMAGLPLLLGSLACLVGGLLTDSFIRRTGNQKWGRRLFGMIGHGVCAVFYFLALTASSPWVFVGCIALAAFWNDITMGSAWASCIDIGGRYSGIVSGCMNTIGNLGGAVAGTTTGWILDGFGPETGWTVNFVSFGLVYVAAVFFWLRFDATKQVPQPA
jgi:MFS family permease